MTRKVDEKSLAQQLADKGREANLAISSEQSRLLGRLSGSDYFRMAIAKAFTWTGHAADQDAFIESAVDYLMTSSPASLDDTRRFSGRFGAETLISALQSWKAVADQLGDQDFRFCIADGLCNMQVECHNIAIHLWEQRQISGLGPWLFCAPFKIIAAHREDLWESQVLDDVWMPLRLEVIRGIRKLLPRRYTFARDIYQDMLSEVEGGLKEGIATVILVNGMSKQIAHLSGSRVVHVNSGLYLLGRGNL